MKFLIILFTVFGFCSPNLLNAQEPYNLKIYEFDARVNQFQTFDRVSDSLIAFHGWSSHNESDSISLVGLLDNNLDVVCVQRLFIDKLVSTANILSVTPDSFLIALTDESYSSEIYSLNSDCELKLLRTIPFDELGSFSFGGGTYNFQYNEERQHYYLLRAPRLDNEFAKTVMIQMNRDLSINWIHSLDTLFQDTALVPSHKLFFKDDTLILHQYFVQDYLRQEDKLNQLMVSKIDRNTGELLDYCVNLNEHLYYPVVQKFKVLEHSNLNDHYFVAHGRDTSMPFFGSPNVEQLYFKPSLALFKGCEMVWNKPYTESDWGFNYGPGALLYSHDRQSILIPSMDRFSYGKPYGLLSMLDLEGNEIWTRKYDYAIDEFDVIYRLYNMEYAADGKGYIIAGQYIQISPPDTVLRNRQKAMFFYVDEYGCMIPGCGLVDDRVQRLQEMEFMLYPNPASHQLTLYIPNLPSHLRHEEMQLQFYDMQGRLVRERKVSTDQLHIQMEVSSWQKGTYIAVLSFENGERVVKKFVVQ